jgi:hypothetical protein
MIRIAISQAAFDTIAATMLFGSVNYESKTNAKGERRAGKQVPGAMLQTSPSNRTSCAV